VYWQNARSITPKREHTERRRGRERREKELRESYGVAVSHPSGHG